ncbi:unnamed protein product [Lepidochelys olivacea]
MPHPQQREAGSGSHMNKCSIANGNSSRTGPGGSQAPTGCGGEYMLALASPGKGGPSALTVLGLPIPAERAKPSLGSERARAAPPPSVGDPHPREQGGWAMEGPTTNQS